MANFWVVLLAAVAISCGGGGGGGVEPFKVSGSTPMAGSAQTAIDQALLVVFNRPADPETITTQNVRLERSDGTRVAVTLFVQSFNSSVVNVDPIRDLDENVRHHLILGSGIRALDGARLAPREICFITLSRTPTVRPDQLIDMGDALNVPRYLAQSVRLLNGKILIIGGYTDGADATDTIEIYEPTTRTFRLLDARLSVPRAEFTATGLASGRVMIAGGVSVEGGAPLASTDIFSVGSENVSPGPDLIQARRYHAASGYNGSADAVVSGGFDQNGDELDSIERFNGSAWVPFGATLPVPMARGTQINDDFDKLYFSPSNFEALNGTWTGQTMRPRVEGDLRFRSVAMPLGGGRWLLVGGDTRTMVTYFFDSELSWGASDFLRERRGAHTVTVRGRSGKRLLVAGGFNIAAQGTPALRTMEIVDALPDGVPDARADRVENVLLPVPFAGHVGFNESNGPTVLAGGVGPNGPGAGTGPHSRRVVLIIDDATAPTIDCDE